MREISPFVWWVPLLRVLNRSWDINVTNLAVAFNFSLHFAPRNFGLLPCIEAIRFRLNKNNSFVIDFGGPEKDHIVWLSEKNGFRIKGLEFIKNNSFVIVLVGPKKDQISERKVEDYWISEKKIKLWIVIKFYALASQENKRLGRLTTLEETIYRQLTNPRRQNP